MDDHINVHKLLRSVQRLESTRRSPIFSHLSSSLNGLTVVRSFGAEEMLIKEFDHILNLHTSTYFTRIAILSWFRVALDGISMGNF